MTIPENYYLYVSIFIAAIYAAMIFIGYKRGFLYEAVSLLYTAASLLAAWFVSPVLSSLWPLFDLSEINEKYKLLDGIFNLNKILNTAAYFLIVFLILKLLYVFVSMLMKSLNKLPVIGKFNQVLGALCGVLNATLIAVALSMLLSLPVVKNGADVREKTILKYIDSISGKALNIVVEKLSDTSLKKDAEGIDIDSYREEFRKWLISVSNADE